MFIRHCGAPAGAPLKILSFILPVLPCFNSPHQNDALKNLSVFYPIYRNRSVLIPRNMIAMSS